MCQNPTKTGEGTENRSARSRRRLEGTGPLSHDGWRGSQKVAREGSAVRDPTEQILRISRTGPVSRIQSDGVTMAPRLRGH